MKENLKLIIGALIIVLLITACKKDEPNPPAIPTLTTKSITAYSSEYLKCGGIIDNDEGRAISDSDIGVVWSTHSEPTIADNNSTNVASLRDNDFDCHVYYDFLPNVTYYFRAYAKNNTGIGYGNEVTIHIIMNQPGSTVTDIDGNIYHTVTIGKQLWMVENLKTTKYRDGTDIPNITDNASWYNLATGAYCDYNNSPLNSNIYGRLYNWYAVTDAHNICPVGWHIPSVQEWETLILLLAGDAGSELKEMGTNHWKPSNTTPYAGATNISGFTALPGGDRGSNGHFGYMGTNGLWWTSTEASATEAVDIQMVYFDGSTGSDRNPKKGGFSVRCVKD